MRRAVGEWGRRDALSDTSSAQSAPNLTIDKSPTSDYKRRQSQTYTKMNKGSDNEELRQTVKQESREWQMDCAPTDGQVADVV